MADAEIAKEGESEASKSKELDKDRKDHICSSSSEAKDGVDHFVRISSSAINGSEVRNRRSSRPGQPPPGTAAPAAPGAAPGATTVSTREYATAFRQWMWQYQLWAQAQASLMYTFQMNYMPMTAPFANQTQTFGGVAPGGHVTGTPAGQPGRPAPVPAARPRQNGANQQPIRVGRECQLPALWKRVVAEFIDFFLLFVMKLAASIMVIEYIGILDIEKYDIDQLLAQDWDSNMALSFTSDLIAMEIINRIFICLFETLCLRRGFAGSVGGTTPGKYMMRLRVISCQSVTQLPGNKILVIPGNDIGFWNAFLRSVIKNFSLVFFFPVCFTVFFFPNSRTAYDIASSSIVVEVTPENVWAWPRR